jgi:hypothetical protein
VDIRVCLLALLRLSGLAANGGLGANPIEAATSTHAMMRRLGRNSRRLHRLVHPIALLGVAHNLWLVKA